MQTIIVFPLDKITDPFFLKFLNLFYTPNKDNCVLSDLHKFEENFILYQKCSIFLSLVKKKITFKKIDILIKQGVDYEEITDQVLLDSEEYYVNSEKELEIFFNQIFSKDNSEIAKRIYIDQESLTSIAKSKNISVQAISKRKKLIEKNILERKGDF